MRTLLFLLLALPTMAANHRFTWDANPTNDLVLGYSLYEQLGSPPAWVKRIEVANVTTCTLSNVTPGWHTYGLVATNIIGSSAMSQPSQAFVPILPTPVTNILIQLQARVNGSSGNQVASFFIPQCATERTAFFHGELLGTNFNIMAGPALGGPSGAIAFLPVPSTATQSRLFAGR